MSRPDGSWGGTVGALVVLLAGAAAGPAARNGKAPEPIFETSERCLACHNGLTTAAGEDVSIGFDWRASMMANSARDPYWQAGVRREVMDHPAAQALIEDECAICHMPMARFEAHRAGHEARVLALLPFNRKDPSSRLAADGVSCTLCHQISEQKLGSRESFVGGFVIDAERPRRERHIYGRLKVEPGVRRVMQSSTGGFTPIESEHIRRSELCATCHTLITKALGPDGKVIGELPEQVPYQEWLHSAWRQKASCQDCHMPAARRAPVSSVLGEVQDQIGRHVFVGGNVFMLRMLNRFRNELGVAALPQEFETAALRTVAFLQKETARLAIEAVERRHRKLEVVVRVENLGGHKLPTAYPSRRVWLRLAVRDAGGRLVFESGALEPDGRIRGNDNDADPRRVEPHFHEITRADEVQIYESIMEDAAGVPTTGLLSGVRYVKDNRLLPLGFDKATAAGDVAVVGAAAADGDFTGGGDLIRYLVDPGEATGPFEIEAELWYQPVSYRWAENLRSYDSEETRRFSRYYDQMRGASAVWLARAAARSR